MSSPSDRPRGSHSRGLSEKQHKKSSCAGEPSMRLGESQEAVVHAIRIGEKSRDHAPEVDAQRLSRLYPLARRIKEEILAAWSAREAVTHVVRIDENSRSDSREIGCVGECALKR